MGAAVAIEPSIEREAFTSWLEDKAKYDVVGLACMPKRCPLATFVGPDACVTRSVFKASFEGPYYPTPAWAATFINRIDADFKMCSPVTAEAARAILRSV